MSFSDFPDDIQQYKYIIYKLRFNCTYEAKKVGISGVKLQVLLSYSAHISSSCQRYRVNNNDRGDPWQRNLSHRYVYTHVATDMPI